MVSMTLYQFIDKNRDDLITRCRAKVVKRSTPTTTDKEIDQGIPLFLNQLRDELQPGPSKTDEISKSAAKHGADLQRRGFNLSQVVHGYGDVCQSITDLAVETGAPISTDDFRTLNRCLDDAIAGAVTEYSLVQDATRDGESHEMRDLIRTATVAFEVIRTGNVGVGGATGAVLLRNLRSMDALANRQSAPPVTEGKPPMIKA